MQPANYHAHSHFSDGQGEPEAYLREAIAQKLVAYGFSDHAPILFDPTRPYAFMDLQQLSGYLAEIERLKKAYSGQIQVYKSLEVDYVPGAINVDSEHIRNAGLDYTIGAVHFVDYAAKGRPWYFSASERFFIKGLEQVFNNDIKACVRRYYSLIREMVLNHPPDVVAHLDLIKKFNLKDRYFSEQAPWYREEVIETLEAIAEADVILEVNTQGYYKHSIRDTYPGRWVLKIANELGVPLHLASDAHRPEDITEGFQFGMEVLRRVGASAIAIFLDGQWTEQPLEPVARSNRLHEAKKAGK